jgi:hypothetical protein
MVSQPSPPGNRNNDKTIPASVTPIYDSTGEAVRSTLNALARDGAQRMLVSALEQEIEDFLGRVYFLSEKLTTFSLKS